MISHLKELIYHPKCSHSLFTFIIENSLLLPLISDRLDFWRGKVTEGPSYTDIQSVNYFSDGGFLNATFWIPKLSSNSLGILSANATAVDADFNGMTGVEGIDYKIEDL